MPIRHILGQNVALSVCAYVTAGERADPARLSMSLTKDATSTWHKDSAMPSPLGMRSTKMQKRQPTLLEKQLEAARRDDFEALLQGYNPRGTRKLLFYGSTAIVFASAGRRAVCKSRGRVWRKACEKVRIGCAH